MADEQAALADGFASFADELAQTSDFHIGLIPTSVAYDDPAHGELVAREGEPTFLTRDDDYVTLFRDRLGLVGLDGDDREEGIESATYALSPSMLSGANEGFMREDARLLIVFVSDGHESQERQEGRVPVSEHVKALRSLKSDEEQVQVSVFISDLEYGRSYIEIAQVMGGSLADISTRDWGQMLAALGVQASGIRSRFQTRWPAQPKSLKVWVDDQPVIEHETEGWTYDSETWYLTFGVNAIPDSASEIYAEYTSF